MKSIINRALFSMTVIALATACSKNSEMTQADLIAPNTGYEVTEQQVGVVAPAEVRQSKQFYISAESIRVRTSPDTSNNDNVVGRLYVNDKVEVIDATPVGSDRFVGVRVVLTTSQLPAGMLYVSSKYFNAEPIKIDPAATSLQAPAQPGPQVAGQRPVQGNRLFIVTNIATEKLRVYERCQPNQGCVNRMILETDVVNGEDKDGTHSDVGYYQVSHWVKFYEVYSGSRKTYPAWYKPGYPDVPKPGNRTEWFDKEYMPNGEGDMRGAFGWYTVFVGPNHNGQWTHGTAGWGADKKNFIQFKDTFFGKLVNLFTSIRSHGCTRVDNESIAYIRQLIANGTPLVKIYAQEAYRDPSKSAYPKNAGRWDYILTKNGHQVKNSHQLADRAQVLKAGTPQSEWLDQGSYEIDQTPDVARGDLYSLGSDQFTGHFIVDEGTLLNYRHPSKIKRGGYSDQLAPPYMITSNPDIKGEERASRRRNSGGPRGGYNIHNGYGENYGNGG